MNKLATTTAIALVLGWSGAASAQEVTLRLAHFWPTAAPIHEEIFQAWADAVSEESDGRIGVEIYPSQTLARAPQTYDFVVSGVADIGATVQGYTANRFPLTQVIELPGLVRSARQGSCVLQSLYDEGHLDAEYADSRVLFLFTHGPGHLHTVEAPVETPEDLAGLRIRRPTAVVAQLLEELGAEPVGMPAPEIYTSLQRGVIDGAALPWEGVLSFRANEVVGQHTEIGLYSLAFMVTMNQGAYDRMPADLQAVIDNNSGLAWAARAGDMFDGADVVGEAQADEMGNTIRTIEGGHQNAAWADTLAGATEGYLADLEGRGLASRTVYDRALALTDGCTP